MFRLAITAALYGASALLVAFGFSLGRWVGVATAVLVVGVYLVSRVILPRVAHRAFRAGDFKRARRAYRSLSWIRLAPDARQAVAVSMSACDIAMERYKNALEALTGLPDELPEGLSAARDNNRAYALTKLGEELGTALKAAVRAIERRPTVAGYRHTHALVLLANGKNDAAIREFGEAYRLGSDKVPLLEAERCFDLARAWRAKGEEDYAADYFERAWRAAPDSSWSKRAKAELGDRDHTGRLDDFL